MRFTVESGRSLVLCVLLSSFGAAAQVPPPPLKNVEISAGVSVDTVTRIYSYRYRISNPSQNVLSIAKVSLDITMPANSIRPTGSTKLPSWLGFQDPDATMRLGLGPATSQSWGDYYRARTGLNFVPVGMDGPVGWTQNFGVYQTNKFALLPNAIEALWLGLSETLDTLGIVPGASLDGFIVTSYGLPGIRSMELQPKAVDLSLAGQIPEAWQTSEDDTPAQRLEKRRSIAGLGFLATTIGPTALPAGYTNASLVSRLQGYLDQAAGLGWVPDAAFKQQLTGLLSQASAALQQSQAATAKTLLQQFVAAATSASLSQRRQEASDLLALNAQFIIDRITVGSPVSPTTAILSPPSSQLGLNETRTLTLSVKSGAGPAVGRAQAVVLSGPNAGKTFSGALSNGQWNFSWVGRAEGTDVIQGHYSGLPPHYVVAGDPEFVSGFPCQPDFSDCMDSNSVAVTWSGGPDLTIGHLFPPAVKLPDATNTVTIDETTLNIGTTGAPASKTRYYLSRTPVLDAAATMLGERDVPPLLPNEVSASVRDFTLPSLAPGVFWIIACADGAVQVAELDETNNCQALQGSVAALLDVPTGCDPAKPTVTANGPTTLCPGGTVTLTASQGAAYQWSNGATTQSIVVNQSGSYSAMVTVTAGCSASSDPVLVTIADSQPPAITACAAGRTVPAGPGCQALVPDMRSGVTATDNCTNSAGLLVSQSPSPGAPVGLGVTPVTFSVFDASGNVATCSSTLTVIDTTPPAISAPTASPSSLWPPDHKMAVVTVAYGLSDNCAGFVASSLSISCNEPVNGSGDGNTSVDWQVVDAHHVQLRAERSGTGNGRIYTITITARDAAGNISTTSVPVTVSHNE